MRKIIRLTFLVCLALQISSCVSKNEYEELKTKNANLQEQLEKSNRSLLTIGQSEKGFGTRLGPGIWETKKKAYVSAFRKLDPPTMPVSSNNKQLHGLAISMKDIRQMDSTAEGSDSVLHSIYLMPYKEDKTINFIVAPIYATTINDKLSKACVQTGTRMYNSYTLCPDDCPQIKWNGTLVSDSQASK